jgi:hypothetical protein
MSHEDNQKPLANTTRQDGFAVDASPYNPVKLELGIILIIAIVLWFAQDLISSNPDMQLAVLAMFGLCAAAWIVLRIRKINKRLLAENPQKHPNG